MGAHYAQERFHWSVGGIILQSPFVSIAQLVADFVSNFGAFLVPNYYDNMAMMVQLCRKEENQAAKPWIPTLIVHGEKDEIIDPYHGRSLYNEARRRGHPAIEAAFPPLATHTSFEFVEDLTAPIR